MPAFGLVKRTDLIRHLKRLGFDGPYSGGRHQFMVKGEITIRIPNPHRSDLGVELLSRVLRQAGVNRAEREAS